MKDEERVALEAEVAELEERRAGYIDEANQIDQAITDLNVELSKKVRELRGHRDNRRLLAREVDNLITDRKQKLGLVEKAGPKALKPLSEILASVRAESAV